MVGLAADHQAVEEEDVALVLGAHPRQCALHYKLVADLADVLALPAVDVPLDLVHLLDGQVLALHLLTVEAAGRLAGEREPRRRGGRKKIVCARPDSAEGGECKQRGGSEALSLTILLHTSIVFKALKIERLRRRGSLALSTVAVIKLRYRGFSSA